MKVAFSVSLDIAADPAQVFAYIGDARRHEEWQKGLVDVTTKQPLARGMVYASVSQVLGRKVRSTIEVMDLVPDRLLAVASQSGPLTYKVSYKLTPVDYMTRVECDCKVESNSPLFDMASSLAESLAEDRIRQDLERLKKLVESAAPSLD